MTGASGFMGRQCLPLLGAKGYEVHAVRFNGDGSDDSDYIWHEPTYLICNNSPIW
jgi:hypothetical protein